MPKGTPKKGPAPAHVWSTIGKQNSQNSPWRKAGRYGSKRQRECVAYFDQLAAAGDLERKPRPELD